MDYFGINLKGILMKTAIAWKLTEYLIIFKKKLELTLKNTELTRL